MVPLSLPTLGLAQKELLAILKDPASRAILFAPALIQSFLFGYAATYDLHHVPYAVLDQSQSVASRSLMARVEGTGVFIVLLRSIPVHKLRMKSIQATHSW